MSTRPAWLDARSDPPWRRVALSPVSALAALYGVGAITHRAVYRRGWRRAARLPCAVVSVGGLSAGGSGKTPLAAALAAGLLARGHRVALASRGYGRVAGDEVELVSDGARLRSSAERAGDEPLLLAAHAPGVPVLVARDRAQAGLRAVREFGVEVLVLDDGFQHHRLARDFDLVVLDGAEGLGEPRRPPARTAPRARSPRFASPTRSPSSTVRFRRRTTPSSRASRPTRRASRSAAWRAHPAPRGGRSAGPESPRTRSRGARWASSPASPARRPSAARSRPSARGSSPSAPSPTTTATARRDLAGLASRAPLWLTTEKDAVKLAPGWLAGADLRVLSISLDGMAPLVELAARRIPPRST